MLLLSGCEDALDTQNYTKANTANYPQSVDQAKLVLAGVYNNLNVAMGTPQETWLYAAALASDDQLGGGGNNDKLMQAWDLLLCYPSDDYFAQFWGDRYAGVNRANNAIEAIPNCTGFESDTQKNQMMGESYFLRAYYYYELASMFGNIPMITSTSEGANDVAQADPAVTWGQIVQDCKAAADMMPAKKASSQGLDDGHVDKYAAEALMARAYLFYTGMYLNANPVSSSKPSMTLPDGTTFTYENMVSYIDDCVSNSGYSLVPTFQNLWAYTNRCTVDDYTYTKGKGYSWVENDDAINPEAMFKIKFNTQSSWSTTIGYSNQMALHMGMRGGQDYANTFPFGQGWGAGPVAQNLWSDWQSYSNTVNGGKEDPRMRASICNIPEELPNYKKGGWSDFVQETDFYEKKLTGVTCYKEGSTSKLWSSFESRMYNDGTETGGWLSGVLDNFQLDNIHDLVLIRYAEVLLDQSEIEGSATGMNKVRARVGLPAISYSESNLQNERRWELCFEGTRWNDIRRWHIAETALEKQTGTKTYHAGQPDVNSAHNGGYSARYKATNGFFKIPYTQINLSKVLKQNDGWGSEANYTGW
jgi:hypothetical protein